MSTTTVAGRLRPLVVLAAVAAPASSAAMLPSAVAGAPADFSLHHFAVNAAAAFAASSLATIALHPMDTLKTRLQATTTTTREVPEEAAPLRLSGLYRGVGENVLKEAPDTAVFLAISEQLTQSLAYSSPFFATHLTLTLLLSGAVGDAAGSVFRLPAEVLCKRLQTSSAAGWTEALAGTNRESWMSAWVAILYRDVPMGGLQIATYREAHTLLGSLKAGVADSLPDSFSDVTAGLLAGACAAALTTPLDVLVTHAATTQPDEADGGHMPNAMEICQRLVKEDGPMSLVRGIRWRTLYYAQTVAVFFGLYEYFRRFLEESTGGVW